MTSTTSIAMTAALAVTVLACSSQDGLEPGGDADGDQSTFVEERYGALAAEFVYPRRGWEDGQVQVHGQFLDARGVDVESALEALEVWMPRRGIERGSCELINHGAVSSGVAPASLYLLNLGTIDIESPGGALRLQARRLPDLLSSFYGVVYGSEWVEPGQQRSIEYYPGGDYSFFAPGSDDVAPLSARLTAPDPMVVVAANGEMIGDESALTIDSRDGLDLVWLADDRDGEVFIDLSAGFGPDQARIQCRADDEGAFSVESSLLQALGRHSLDVDLELRRVTRGEVSVEGLDLVEVLFSATDKLQITLQ